MIIYPSDSSFPHLTHKGIDGPEMDTQETWSPAYRALSLPHSHPGIVSGCPWGAASHML